jgi:hypothetical protein
VTTERDRRGSVHALPALHEHLVLRRIRPLHVVISFEQAEHAGLQGIEQLVGELTILLAVSKLFIDHLSQIGVRDISGAVAALSAALHVPAQICVDIDDDVAVLGEKRFLVLDLLTIEESLRVFPVQLRAFVGK